MTEQTAQSPAAYPETIDEVTAASLARHYAVRSLTAYDLITDPAYAGKTGHLASQHLYTFAITALLIRLGVVSDSERDEVAKTLWEAAANPPQTVVMLGDWLRDMGIDPNLRFNWPTKPDPERAEVDKLRAELEQVRRNIAANDQQIATIKGHYQRRAETLTARAERAETERDEARWQRDQAQAETERMATKLGQVIAARDADMERLRAELAGKTDPDRAEADRRWNEAIDWLLNSRHTGDPDIQGPFWAYVDGHITRDELDKFRAGDVREREREIGAKTPATESDPQPTGGPALDVATP